MRRVIIEKRITHQRCLDLAVWALTNDIPIIELWQTDYFGRKMIVQTYEGYDSSDMLACFDWKLCVREQDAAMVLLWL